MDETSLAESTIAPRRSARQFLRHYLEMVVTMIIGMVVLAPLWSQVSGLLGWSALLERADLGASGDGHRHDLGTGLWMRYRGHSWISIAEMGAAMYIPFIVLFIPFRTGLISGHTLMIGGHVLMLPCTLVPMLLRRDEYTRHHH